MSVKLEPELPSPMLKDGAFEMLRVWKDGGEEGGVVVCLRLVTDIAEEGASPAEWGVIVHDVAKNVARAICEKCRTPDGKPPEYRRVLNEVVHYFMAEHMNPTDVARPLDEREPE